MQAAKELLSRLRHRKMHCALVEGTLRRALLRPAGCWLLLAAAGEGGQGQKA
jgi:hypothetical protein